MKKTGILEAFSTVLVSVAVLSAAGCVTTVENPAERIAGDKKIAIAPFINYSDKKVLKETDPKTGKNIDTVSVEDYLTGLLVSGLKQKNFQKLMVLPKLIEHQPHKLTFGLISKDVPPDTDYIIVSRIFRFRERKGGNYSVRAPASVAFDIRVIDCSDGRIIHNYGYNETQRSLSENILNLKKFIRRKGRWVKAIELATYGVNEAVEKIAF